MKYKVIFHPDAKSELNVLEDWLTEGAPIASVKWLKGLIEMIRSLDSMPFRFPVTPTQTLPKDVRSMVYKPYRIYYQVIEDRVIILHIRHTSRKPI